MKKNLIYIFFLALALTGFSTVSNGALPAPSCSISSELSSTVVIYDDSTNPAFTENIWDTTVTTVTNANSGNFGLKVDFNEAWSGIEFNSDTLYEPDTVGAIQLAVQGSKSGHNVRIYLLDQFGKKLGVDVALSDYLVGGFTPDWQVAWVPISDMHESLVQLIGGIGVQSETTGTIWLDDIRLVTPEPHGLVTLYDEYLHRKLHNWLSHVSVSDGAFGAGKSMKIQTTDAWGGVTLRSNRPISEDDFGAITIAVKTDAADLDLYIYAVDQDGERIGLAKSLSSFVYGGAIPTDWQVAWIPIQTLIQRPIQGTFIFHGIGIESSVPANVWVDEVKVVEKLRWVLPEFPVGNHTTGHLFGDIWSGSASTMLHAGIDYNVCGAIGIGSIITAAHAGKVIAIHTDSDIRWGSHVVLQSHGKAFTTRYTHIAPATELTIGKEVEVGDIIGVIQDIPSGPHLDFTVRMLPSVRYSGALSPSEFPEAYVNPGLVWQTQTISPESCTSIVP